MAERVRVRMPDGQLLTGIPGDSESWSPEPGQKVKTTLNPFSLLDRANRASQRVEQTLGTRPSAIENIRREPSALLKPSLLGPIKPALKLGGAAFEAIESIPANIGLGLQAGRPAGEIAKDVVAGVKGERPAQLGDVYRASGLPIIGSEPFATAAGLTLASAPGLLKNPEAASQGLIRSGKVLGTAARHPFETARKVKTAVGGILQSKKASDIALKAQRAYREIPFENMKQYGSSIESLVTKKPDVVVPLQDVVEGVAQRMASDRRYAAHVKLAMRRMKSSFKDETLQTLLKNPTSGAQANAQQAQAVYNTLIKADPLKNKMFQSSTKLQDLGLDLKDTATTIRQRMLEAYPELSSIRRTYEEGLAAHKALKGAFDNPRRILPAAERGAFEEPVTRSLLEKHFPKDVLEELDRYGRKARFRKGAGRLAGRAAGAAAFGALGYLGAKEIRDIVSQ